MISGFLSLCPAGEGQNGLSAYHWQIVVHLARFSAITQQGTLLFMQRYFQEHRWQRNVRFALTTALLLLLFIAMVPTAFFNWYSKRSSLSIFHDNIACYSLSKSAAQPSSPASCYFDISNAKRLFSSAEPCQIGGFNPDRPSWFNETYVQDMNDIVFLSDAHAGRIKDYSPEFIAYTRSVCDIHAKPFETAAFQAVLIETGTLSLLFLWNASRLFGVQFMWFGTRARTTISRYSRRSIRNISTWAERAMPTTGEKPEPWEVLVELPLLSLHLTGRLALDWASSALAKVSHIFNQTLTSMRHRITLIWSTLRYFY